MTSSPHRCGPRRSELTSTTGAGSPVAPSPDRSPTRTPRVLLVTVPSDAHMWNLVFLQLLLEENGYEVRNLGHCTAVAETVEAALRMRPDAIVVSTVNGHGHIEGVSLIEEIRRHPELREVRTVIGGKLGIDGGRSTRSDELLAAGFNAVVEAASSADPTQSLLTALGNRPVNEVAA